MEKYAAHSVAKCIKINPDYTFSRTPTQENATADYAFLILREPVTIPAARFYNKDTITQDDRLVHAGYCCDRRYLLSAHDGCQVKYRWRNAYLTDCDTAAGASGGPVFVKKNDKHYLAAVMTTMFAGDETQQEPLNAVTSILQERDNMDEIKNCR